MKWTYLIKNKLTASAVLLTLCLLVLLSNYLDRLHTKNVTNAISTLYEDRLLAEEYIFKMTTTIYQVREILQTGASTDSKANTVSKLMNVFADSYQTYSKTKLTPTEKTIAIELHGYFIQLKQTFASKQYGPSADTDKALSSLNRLSTVQLEESKLIMKNVELQYATIKASSQFAFAIGIIILLVLQAIVFTAKAVVPVNIPTDTTLN
ncbi:MAG: hypothetical protein EPO58_09515 [Chitinophagaceae bacterium]|nr:MAG: hypothetical protein EPO58_09515 [Chitinophagaceae bacterium]